MTLGEYISEYIGKHAMSQRQFAINCGLTNGYISMLVSGVNPRTGKPLKPTIDTYMKLANGMGITLDKLFDDIDDNPVRLTLSEDDEDELWEIREELRRNPEYRSMLKLTKGATKREMEQIKQMIRVIRGSNDYDETDTP